MNAPLLDEYLSLERQSSDLLLERDFLRVRGEPVKAAYRSFQAGELRKHMGTACVQEGRYVEAAEDWLSSAQCFLDARAPQRVGEVVASVQELIGQGRIPALRDDLRNDLDDRVQTWKQLDGQRQAFLKRFQSEDHLLDTPNPGTLASLEASLPLLFGEPLLHCMIYRQAELLKQPEKAARYLYWAAAFDPTNPNLTALLGYQYLGAAETEKAVALGEAFLQRQPAKTGAVRVMLATALASRIGNGPGEHHRASDVLRPLIAASDESARQRLAGLILLAVLQRELGEVKPLSEALAELEQVAQATPAAKLRSALREVQQALAPSVNGTGSAPNGFGSPLPEAMRQRFFGFARELSLESPVLAA